MKRFKHSKGSIRFKPSTTKEKSKTRAGTHIFVMNVSRTWLSSVIPSTSDIRAYTCMKTIVKKLTLTYIFKRLSH